MTREKRNVLVLSACQVLFGTGRSLLIATAPLIAYGIAENKGLATLPTSLVIIGTAVMTIPASLFMRRVGRRVGFIFGSFIGVVSGLLSAYAVFISDFWLFALSTFLFGFFSGFAQLYRFAAADVASEDFKSKAISLVLAGGVVAGFLGPESAKLGQNLVTSTPFVGAYLILTATTFASIFVLLFLDIPPLTSAERAGPRRPISTIMMQPVFLAAALAAMISQGVMNFLMTASPIAMATCGLPFSDTAFVIEWHIFGMFAPGFFTGHLVKKFGEVKIIICGLFLQFVCVLVALEGIEVAHFWLSMFLLGVGWNFAFTAGTSLMTTAYRTSERAKTQGAMNFLIYGFVSIMSLSSGALVHYFGWSAVNFGALPFLVIAVIATLWYAISQNQGEVRST